MIRFFTCICCLCFSSFLLAQRDDGIQTENQLGVEDLIKNVFIKGNCRNVSNIQAIGNDTLSIGQFDGGSSTISINDGIIISTGDIKLAPGPNNSSDASFPFNATSNDSDLSQLATSSLFDVTGIEFDFVPLDDQVTFRYVFASEEYCEFVGTSFNDVFGFFVSGPGINGPFENNAINVATLIETGEDVSINNVNHLKNTRYYVNNVTNLDAEACEINFSSIYQDLIEYDGFTIPLVATFRVIPCETYHIRLVVGDVGDPNLDSAVFLETNSFDLGEKVNVRVEVPGRDEPIAYESCVDGQFVFTRNSFNAINEDCTVDYILSPEGDAINGIDFLEIPLSVTIPAGDTSLLLPITILEDDIPEDFESLKLEFIYDCECIDPIRSELMIGEAPKLSASFEEIMVCANQAFSITPEIMGGVPPFNFLWETGLTADTLRTSISTPSDYTLSISDFCGDSTQSIASIGIQEIPTATLMGTYDFCETITSGIPIFFEGNAPWRIEYNIDGIEQIPIENIQTNPFNLPTPSVGAYTLVAFGDAYCEGQVIGNAQVEQNTFLITTDIVPPSCLNSFDGSIEITELKAIPPFFIEWNIDTENDYLINNLEANTYTLNIVDGNGCLYKEVFDLSAISDDVVDCAPFYIPNSFSPNNDGINDVFSIFFDSSTSIEKVTSFQVYNRWGALIFEEDNYLLENKDTHWKGDYKGKPLDAGVYLYKIMITYENGSSQLVSGDITLFR